MIKTETLLRALVEALEAEDEYIHYDEGYFDFVTLDGQFNLERVAAAVCAKLEQGQ